MNRAPAPAPSRAAPPAWAAPPGLALAGALALLAGACRTLEAVGDQIEESSERSTEAAPPEPPPLPARPLETIARLEAMGTDGDGLLEALLAHGDDATRERAALALARLDAEPRGRAATTRALADALADPAPRVRAAAAFALGLRGDPAAEQALLERWLDRSFVVRAAMVEAASRIGTPKLCEVVLTALEDPALTVRSEAAVGPHRWPDDDAATAEAVERALVVRARTPGTDGEVVWRVLFTLQRRGSVLALPLYLAEAEHADPRVRLFACKGLARVPEGQLGDARAAALETLARSLADPDWRVACEATRGLGAHPDARSIAPLARALDHPSAHVQVEAARALGAFAGHEAEVGPLLRDAQQEPTRTSDWAAAAAIEAECRLLGGDASLAWAESDSALERAGVARGLRWAPAETAVPLLDRLTRDPSARVRWFAVESLGAHVDAARGRLHELCADPDNGLRLGAVLALRAAPELADLPPLATAYRAEGDVADEVAFDVLRTAAGIPRADDPDGEVLRFLERGLVHDAPYVRQVALELLRERSPGRARDLPPGPAAFDAPAPDADLPSYRTATLVTSRGPLTFRLLVDETPRHVTSFVRLAETGAYDGLDFHRVVPDFVAQGGDYRGDGNGARPFGGTALRRELTPRKFVRGSLGMPRNADPDSGGSQLFVTHRETPHLDGRYTLFGELIEGFDTLDRVEVGTVIERVLLR